MGTPAEPWVDSHGHLFMIEDDPADVLDRAVANGVGWMLSPGVDVPTSEQSRELAARFPDRVLWSAGLHPHDAQDWPEAQGRIAELAAEADAIGECGLDWYRNLAPRDDQLVAFNDQVTLAKDLDKPIIIHCRDAFRDIYEILSEADLGEHAVLHCWTGGSKWTKRFRDLGVTFSLAGALTFKTGETLQHAARFLPRERTMVETDSPYLTPEPLRGEPNEPANVVLTGEFLAGLWGLESGEVAALTTATATRVFGGPRG
ncbi:MAG: TatD family hydrolase [Actinomycetota bacterium]